MQSSSLKGSLAVPQLPCDVLTDTNAAFIPHVQCLPLSDGIHLPQHVDSGMSDADLMLWVKTKQASKHSHSSSVYVLFRPMI